MPAYLTVNVFAKLKNSSLFVLYKSAALTSKGSSAFGSLSNDEILNNNLEVVKAGLQLLFNISKQILPYLLYLDDKF